MQTSKQDLEKIVTHLTTKMAAYQKFYDYYKGIHTWNFSSKKFKTKYGQRLQTLRENLCRTVVKAPASRLQIINFLAEKQNTENPAWKIWKRNKMPLNSGKVHREAFKTGEAFVMVWVDKNGRARIETQTAANVAVWKSAETGETEKAAKMWLGTDGKYYLTVYYADRIEKYVSKHKRAQSDSKSFVVREVAGEPFPLGNPYKRVPVFRFTFDEEADDVPNSILSDVIPLNDALNKSYADIFVGQEYNSMRQRHVAGLRVEVDEETGKKIEPYKADDSVWIAEDNETKFGEFTDANLESMLKVKQETVKDIALVSGIPPSYFNLEDSGSAISGEALRKLEARFTSIVQDAQLSFGEGWDEVIGFAMEIDRETKTLETKDLQIETQWTDAAPVSETEILDNAIKKKSLGWSEEQIQRDYGLTDGQIEKMKEEIANREKAKMETQAKFFDAGNSNY
ncbi:MAG: phage portal protein [Pyrinomonadaceae bacterium]|nr:phage portal protein [Pyrinomonadaceae bacterium]